MELCHPSRSKTPAASLPLLKRRPLKSANAMNIVVADDGGNLVAPVRMDGAWLGSIDISITKAYTSRAFDISTKDLATHSQSGGQFFGIPCVQMTARS
jgi:uncharacterized protein GlcG (DUF336 family)